MKFENFLLSLLVFTTLNLCAEGSPDVPQFTNAENMIFGPSHSGFAHDMENFLDKLEASCQYRYWWFFTANIKSDECKKVHETVRAIRASLASRKKRITH